MLLSDNFSLAEAIASELAERLGISNNPHKDLIEVMKKTAAKMEKVRAALGNSPIHINSWFRCLELNRALRSSDTSQHIKGEAVDFICPQFGTPTDIVKHLVKEKLLINFDQIILEHTWVHISFKANPGSAQRNQVLSLLQDKKYAIGITDKFGNPLAQDKSWNGLKT